jgi:hypothetical protein
MTYAAPTWGFNSKSSMKSLQAVLNKALRLIGGYDRYTLTNSIAYGSQRFNAAFTRAFQ